jgi:predicted phosphoribosyltransferase
VPRAIEVNMGKLVLSQERNEPDITVAPDLTDQEQVFDDRRHAGEILSELLWMHRGTDAWVVAIPAGGVPVAAEMAHRLELPFDVAVVSKVWLPWNREAGFGAVAFDGSMRLNEPLIRELALSDLEVRYGIEKTRARVERRVRELRGERGYGHLNGRTVILVDDGIASGFTMLAAISALRRLEVGAIEVAVPTASREAADCIVGEVERLFCANLRGGFPFAVADAYRHWKDVTESELEGLLSGMRFPEELRIPSREVP